MDSRWRSTWHWVHGLARGVGAAALVVGITAGVTLAQDVPSSNSGPMFGDWGPGRPPPGGAPQLEPAAPHEGAPGPLGAPAPGAPAPGIPSPNWGGCSANLSGAWGSTGQETTPTPFQYSGSVQVSQWGAWVQATESQGAAQTQYYGRCQGDSVAFDVYANGQFIGYQSGTISAWAPRWAGPRVNFTWTSWVPQYSTGTESWRRLFQ